MRVWCPAPKWAPPRLFRVVRLTRDHQDERFLLRRSLSTLVCTVGRRRRHTSQSPPRPQPVTPRSYLSAAPAAAPAHAIRDIVSAATTHNNTIAAAMSYATPTDPEAPSASYRLLYHQGMKGRGEFARFMLEARPCIRLLNYVGCRNLSPNPLHTTHNSKCQTRSISVENNSW
jgi:hypothetical protein